MKTARQLAHYWLSQVFIHGRSVNQVLAKEVETLDVKQRALAKQLMFGSLRFFPQLQTLANNLVNKPFKEKDRDLVLVIVLGLYQLKYLSIPDHAAISESVELTRYLKKSWASGLINGVLRRFQRERTELESCLAKSIQFQTAHPGWIVKKLEQDWTEKAAQILSQNNQHPPMTVRVNQQKSTRQSYLEKLLQAGISALPHEVAADAVVLQNALDVKQLPGFAEGEVTVQDAAAQLPIELLDLQNGLRVLDACAAPGGKTTHILQRQPEVELVAVESQANRASRINQTIERLGFCPPDYRCSVLVSDVTETDHWWDGKLFDRILLDVPCSASGVIRRNPDIKIHRKVTDIQPLLELQAKILATCWQLLKPGGILVYATCSLFKDENENQIRRFIGEHKGEVLKLAASIENKLPLHTNLGYQIFPGDFQMDGFYFCGLKKLD